MKNIARKLELNPSLFWTLAFFMAPTALAAQKTQVTSRTAPSHQSSQISTIKTSNKEKLFHASGGLVVPTKITDVDQPTKYRGLEVELGRKFDLGSDLNTTTSGYLSAISGKYVGDGFSATDQYVSLGLRQNLGFDINMSSQNVLTPHIRVGAAAGTEYIEGSISGYRIDGKVNYYQLLGGIGIRHRINRFAWFLNYDMSQITSEKKGELKVSGGSGDSKVDVTQSINVDDRKSRMNTLSGGISLLF